MTAFGWFFLVGVCVLAVIAVLALCCCAVAGRVDRWEEEDYLDRLSDSSGGDAVVSPDPSGRVISPGGRELRSVHSPEPLTPTGSASGHRGARHSPRPGHPTP